VSVLGRVRAFAYKRGLRPRPGSILHSPTLHYRYLWTDHAIDKACAEAMSDGAAMAKAALERDPKDQTAHQGKDNS